MSFFYSQETTLGFITQSLFSPKRTDPLIDFSEFGTLLGRAARRRFSIQRSLSAAELQPKQWILSELITSKQYFSPRMELCTGRITVVRSELTSRLSAALTGTERESREPNLVRAQEHRTTHEIQHQMRINNLSPK